jgi:hypothetical protein
MPSVQQSHGRNHHQDGCGVARERQKIRKFGNDDSLDISEIKSPIALRKRIPADAQQMVRTHPQGMAHENS